MQARVFDFNNETFAGYFSYAFGIYPETTNPYGDETLADEYSQKMKTLHGGEFGFLYGKGPISFRFGMELLAPSTLKEIKATLNGNDVYTIESDFSAYAPKAGLEINLVTRPIWRIFAGASYGVVSASLKNTYSEVSSAPPGDHAVYMKSSSTLIEGYLGGELYMNDTTTITVSVGQKNVNFDKWIYSQDTTTFTGAHEKGDPVLLSDGTARSFSLSNQFVSIGFRIYLM